MRKISPEQIDQAGATDGQTLVWDESEEMFSPSDINSNTVTFSSNGTITTANTVSDALVDISDFLFCLANS